MKARVRASLLVITAGVSYVLATRGVPESSDIQARSPEMPLLKSWLSAIDRNEVPQVNGQLHALTAQPITGIDWRRASVSLSEAKLYNAGADVAAQIEYSPHPTSDDLIMELLYMDKEGLHRSNVNTLFWLAESKGVAVAIGRPSMWGTTDRRVQPSGKPLLIRTRGKAVEMVDLPSAQVRPSFQQQYYQLYNPAKKVLMIYNQLSGKATPIIPEFADNKLPATADWDQRQVGDELVVGGAQGFMQTGKELVWHVLPKGSTTWKTLQRKLNPSYFKSLLPKPLQGMEMGAPDTPIQVRVWKDGSLILRIYGSQQQGDESLRCVALVLQPRQGSPRLLTWTVYHFFDFDLRGDEPRSLAAQSRSSAYKTFNHMWYPGENGQVASHFIQADWTNDLIFDVDGANDAVIYLLGGQLWAVDLSKAK